MAKKSKFGKRNNMKLGILGCGNMGEAFLQSILAKKIFSAKEILVCDLRKDRREELVKKYKVFTTDKIQELEDQDIILLAIKPQNLRDLPCVKKEKIVISMLVGTSVSKIRTKFSQAKIIRIMPNLGQFVGLGMTGAFWEKESSFSAKEKEVIQMILTSGGKVLALAKEELIDKLSAISGSGPAYFFLFAEKMVEAAIDLGFTIEEAEKLVKQTFIGSAEIIKNKTGSLADWRKKVTSPQGTTEKAVEVFEKENLGEIVFSAIKVAEKRAKELEKEL